VTTRLNTARGKTEPVGGHWESERSGMVMCLWRDLAWMGGVKGFRGKSHTGGLKCREKS